MANVTETFLIIQCSPLSGQLVKGNMPQSSGEEVAQKHDEDKQSFFEPC